MHVRLFSLFFLSLLSCVNNVLNKLRVYNNLSYVSLIKRMDLLHSENIIPQNVSNTIEISAINLTNIVYIRSFRDYVLNLNLTGSSNLEIEIDKIGFVSKLEVSRSHSSKRFSDRLKLVEYCSFFFCFKLKMTDFSNIPIHFWWREKMHVVLNFIRIMNLSVYTALTTYIYLCDYSCLCVCMCDLLYLIYFM